ncbi:hypothetical protein EVC03_061 [Rhizobium phage RHph_Y5A]|nr:hypothetical protein EVC03_061 [Rhizobium phage RHph_Y5A]QIG75503.1 hypothetical protein EVC18_061 [Rhizobium phage RHph_Y2_4]
MFEAGKQYLGKYSNRIIEVICVGEATSFVKLIRDSATVPPCQREFLIDKHDYGSWTEYTPPKVHTEEIVVGLRDDSDFMFRVNGSVVRQLVGRIRLTYTEGGKLAVEVLE